MVSLLTSAAVIVCLCASPALAARITAEDMREDWLQDDILPNSWWGPTWCPQECEACCSRSFILTRHTDQYKCFLKDVGKLPEKCTAVDKTNSPVGVGKAYCKPDYLSEHMLDELQAWQNLQGFHLCASTKSKWNKPKNEVAQQCEFVDAAVRQELYLMSRGSVEDALKKELSVIQTECSLVWQNNKLTKKGNIIVACSHKCREAAKALSQQTKVLRKALPFYQRCGWKRDPLAEQAAAHIEEVLGAERLPTHVSLSAYARHGNGNPPYPFEKNLEQIKMYRHKESMRKDLCYGASYALKKNNEIFRYEVADKVWSQYNLDEIFSDEVADKVWSQYHLDGWQGH